MDPATGKRKSYYSRESQFHANQLAKGSYGIQRDDSFFWYFSSCYVPSVKHRSDNWRKQIAWAMDGFILKAFGAKPISSITRGDIQTFCNRLSPHLQPKSISHVYKVLAAVFSLAEVDGEIPRTPCLKIRLPRIEAADKTALTFEELRKLIDHAPEIVKPFILLGACGLRPGEACAPSWKEISKEGVLHVAFQILQPVGRVERTPKLKTPQSNRLVPLPDYVLNQLRESRSGRCIWVVPNDSGGFMLTKSLQKPMREACELAGLKRIDSEGNETPLYVSPNELRHTFISLMENQLEAPTRIVERLSGKASKGKTAPYSHTEMQQLSKWMNRYWSEVARADEILTTNLTTEETA